MAVGMLLQQPGLASNGTHLVTIQDKTPISRRALATVSQEF